MGQGYTLASPSSSSSSFCLLVQKNHHLVRARLGTLHATPPPTPTPGWLLLIQGLDPDVAF